MYVHTAKQKDRIKKHLNAPEKQKKQERGKYLMIYSKPQPKASFSTPDAQNLKFWLHVYNMLITYESPC